MAPNAYSAFAGAPIFRVMKHIQRKMKVQAHRIPDDNPAAWKRNNDGVGTVPILLHREREPMSCILVILEDHAVHVQPR